MTDETEDPYQFEGIYTKIQRVEAEIGRRYPDRPKRPVLILMGSTVPSYAELLAQAIEGVHQSQVIFANAAERTAFDTKRILEAFEAQYQPKRPIVALIDEVKLIYKESLERDRTIYDLPRRSGRKGAGHAAARDRVISKAAYTQKRK